MVVANLRNLSSNAHNDNQFVNPAVHSVLMIPRKDDVMDDCDSLPRAARGHEPPHQPTHQQ